MLALADSVTETSKADGLPLEAKAALARAMVRLRLDQKKVATMTWQCA
jgi:hypothetical protein